MVPFSKDEVISRSAYNLMTRSKKGSQDIGAGEEKQPSFRCYLNKEIEWLAYVSIRL